jgi:hypothetical protein
MTSEQSRHIVKLVYNHIACQRLNFTVYCSYHSKDIHHVAVHAEAAQSAI